MSIRTRVFCTTSDNVHIVGDYVIPEDDLESAVVLLHMMPANRHSFETFQEVIAQCGIASLAIDLRGHGESTQQTESEKPLSYKDFSPEEHQASIEDVNVAVRYLHELTNIPLSRISLIGASVGANLAIQYASQHHDIPTIIALSPGLDYRGIHTQDAVRTLKKTQKLFLCSSTEDTYSYSSVDALEQTATSTTASIIREGSEHGTDMFIDEDFLLKIVKTLCTLKV